jgi:kynurenine formamidase
VSDCLKDILVYAVLGSVEPKERNGDVVISKDKLRKAIGGQTNATAVIVRTLPNDDRKLSSVYGAEDIPPYFTTEALEYIVECGFKHLLVDLPSIDRLFDEGKLTNHRIFWGVEADSFEVNTSTRTNATITELIYVPNEVPDGEYLLNLQIAPFMSDAAPSRPILFRLEG